MQPWLRNSIIAVVASICLLSIGWWSVCNFMVGPALFQATMAGKLKEEPTVCQDVDSRAVQTLTALLATLIGLGSTPQP
jgi:NADH:ubiquinone oxidoreductase subunit 4 (subunit M)